MDAPVAEAHFTGQAGIGVPVLEEAPEVWAALALEEDLEEALPKEIYISITIIEIIMAAVDFLAGRDLLADRTVILDQGREAIAEEVPLEL